MKHFHNTFLDILNGKDPLKEKDFPEFTFELKTEDDIVNNACYFIKGIKRQQELLNTNINYYVAKDDVTNTVYICFRNLLMIDIDINKLDNSIEINDEFIIDYFSKKKESFRIYKSINGYHIFCTSKKFKYRSKESVKFMIDNMCDKHYCLYSYLRGYCVRLNPKFNELTENNKTEKIYKLLAITNKNNELNEQKKKLELVDRLLHKYKKTINLNIVNNQNQERIENGEKTL